MSSKYTVRLSQSDTLDLPLVKMSNGIRIALYNPYDVSLAEPVLKVLIGYLKSYHFTDKGSVDTVVVPATKPIPLAWYIAQHFGWDLVVLKKDKKPYHRSPIYFDAKSITSDKSNKLFIEAHERDLLRNKNVLFFDDVLSTGATYRASKKFLKTVCKVKSLRALFVFKEGHAYRCGKEVSYFGQLPLEVKDDEFFRKRSQETSSED